MGDSDLPAIRYAIKAFMEEQAPSNFMKERWAASYDPARKVTYVSWFLGTVAYFLDKLDFTTLVPFEFEPVRTAENAHNALTAVIGAMAAGEITGAEAAEAMRPIQLFLETLVLR